MDLINIGKKIKQLRIKRDMPQKILGQQAFGKSVTAAQTHIRKIERGEWKKFTTEDLQNILNILGSDMAEFENMPVPQDESKTGTFTINGEEVPPEFLAIWPNAPKYFRMLKDAQDANDETLEDVIKQQMVVSLRAQAASYKELSEAEKKTVNKKEA